MAEYISKEEVINITAETGAWETQNRVRELPASDVQPVDKITKIIQSRLNGVQNAKINAMLSGDCNTAYKMVGAETVCIAILQDLEAIKG